MAGRGAIPKFRSRSPDRKTGNPPTSNTKKFEEASAKLKASVQRHLKYTSYHSSSSEDELEELVIFDKVLVGFKAIEEGVSLGNTQEYLEQSFQSGALTCLICIQTIKRTHKIWSCDTCFGAFHLDCIHRWGMDSIHRQSTASSVNGWACPKCRYNYTEHQIPSKYFCFCKKTIDPPFETWLVPHSCGNNCEKPLMPECGHFCLLLCHPGPCPPCPKIVSIKCECGQSEPKSIRCKTSYWTCKRICNKKLTCGEHYCTLKCHIGDCKNCTITREQTCICKRHTMDILCDVVTWKCHEKCGKMLPCGDHVCMDICHDSDCKPCPISQYQQCPCGATQFLQANCQDIAKTCGSTCNKLLSCGYHTCSTKCHRGECPQCLVVVEKMCRCGSCRKELPCFKTFLCENKCKKTRDCGRHQCNRKCCDECPPCEKICSKTLKCGKHKCTSNCHHGSCLVCQIPTQVKCHCNRTVLDLPCGGALKVQPIPCFYDCKKILKCGHYKKHKCHTGSCPSCKESCSKLLPCGHKCKAICHVSVSVALPVPTPTGPWDLRVPKVEQQCLPCPPCKAPVIRNCLGYHEDAQWPCSTARVASCGRICGRPLLCNNHSCSLECHNVNDIAQSSTQETYTMISTNCEVCEKECDLPRPEGCSHVCDKPCHPAPCALCKSFIKKPCHCGQVEMFIECYKVTESSDESKELNMSCGLRCDKKMQCGHQCLLLCHSGPCPTDQLCTKKTRIYCRCRRLKKDFPCQQVQNIDALIPCNLECEEKLNSIKDEEKKLLTQHALAASDVKNKSTWISAHGLLKFVIIPVTIIIISVTVGLFINSV